MNLTFGGLNQKIFNSIFKNSKSPIENVGPITHQKFQHSLGIYWGYLTSTGFSIEDEFVWEGSVSVVESTRWHVLVPVPVHCNTVREVVGSRVFENLESNKFNKINNFRRFENSRTFNNIRRFENSRTFNYFRRFENSRTFNNFRRFENSRTFNNFRRFENSRTFNNCR